MLWCDWAVLETCDSMVVREREAHWVKYFVDAGCEVLNLAKDCRDGFLSHSEETKEMIRQMKLNHPRSAEVRQRISKGMHGTKNFVGRHSPETCLRISEAKRGHLVSEVTRHKLREAALRRTVER
jgi:hypothetical protein